MASVSDLFRIQYFPEDTVDPMYLWGLHAWIQPTTYQKYQKKITSVLNRYIHFSLSLFSKQNSVTPIYIALMLYLILLVTYRRFKVCGRMRIS
jgi:hypothetical protein